MSELLKTLRGALTLNVAALARFRDRANVFRDGILVLVLVALVVGLVAFAVDFVGSLVTPPEKELARIRQQFEQMSGFMPPGADQAFNQEFLGNLEAGLGIGQRVAALPTRLPKVLSRFFEALGGWVHRPLAMLGGFLGYGIWVMLAAKLLGGRGRVQEFMGTAALSALPYLLLILEKVPCLGSLLGLVAWLWSTLMWIAATAVVHGWATPVTNAEGVVERYQVRWGRAFLAVILPVLALGALGLVGVISLGVIIAVTS